MNIEALKIFCDVARLRSFSRAAQENNVAQSTASQAVAQLETRMEAKFVDRSTRPLQLTPEGKVFYEECLDLVEQYLTVEEQVRAMGKSAPPTLAMSTMASLDLRTIGPSLLKLKQEIDRARINLLVKTYRDQVLTTLLREEAELALTNYGRETEEIKVTPWRKEPILVVSGPQHPIANSGLVSVKDLKGLGCIGFHEHMGIHLQISEYLEQNDISLNIIKPTGNIRAMKQRVVEDDAIAFLALPSVRGELQSGKLVQVPVSDFHLERPVDILTLRKRQLSTIALRMIELLHEYALEFSLTPEPAVTADT